MKFAQSLLMALTLSISAVTAVFADGTLPETGTYFIVNAGNGDALQPLGPTPGNNVFVYPFNKGGLQKWIFTRYIDPVSKKPTNRYTIKIAGEGTSLFFAPHDMVERTSILDSSKSDFAIQPGPNGFLIKSIKRNGDALYAMSSPNQMTETRFGPDDGSAKFRWAIDPAN